MSWRFLLALLVFLLAFAASAPAAFAQAVAGEEGTADDSDETNVTVVDCSQVQQAIQGQYGDANATADDGSVAAAANTLGISQNQVNACLGGGNPGGNPEDGNPEDGNPEDGNPEDGNPEGGANGNGSGAGADQYGPEQGDVDNPDDVMAGTGNKGPLPDTGGAPLALGAAFLLLTAGLLARRALRP